MIKTQYYVAASIDGYIADSQGRLDWLFHFDGAEGIRAHYDSFFDGVGALAMGAGTYEFMLEHAGTRWPYPDRTTWVFTHRDLPKFPGGDIRFTSENVEDVHATMVHSASGKNIWLVGGGNLVSQFVDRGLVDEILLGLTPVILGGGSPLLTRAVPGVLALEEIDRLGHGFLALRYRLAKQ
jgi:dihydrofolate reductase